MRILVTNQKCGVGKTTIVYHLAHLFARDKKVLLMLLKVD